MMKKTILIATVLLAGAMAAFKGYAAKNENADWKTLEKNGWQIQYPGDLEVNTSGAMGTSFSLFFGQASPDDMFRENINLIVQDLSGHGLSLDEYVEISEAQVATFMPDGRMIESRRFEKDGAEYHKMVYTGTHGALSLKYEQYYTLRGGKAYVLTFTAEADQFDNYKATAEKIMDSFRVK